VRLVVTGRRASVGAVLVIALALAGGWWAAALRPDTRPPLTSALDVLPARTTIVGFTDWAQIRETVGLGVVDTAGERDELQNEPASRDLTTRSVLGSSVEVMHDALGWSPAELDWEVFGQDPRGAADVVRLDDSVSFDDVRTRLRGAGYRQDGEVWSTSKGTRLPSIADNVALVPRQRLVVMSDVPAQIPLVLDVIAGRARSLAGNHAAADTAEALAGSDSALLQAGTLGCTSTAIPTDRGQAQQARTAVERVGRLEAYRFSGRGLVDRGGAGFSAQRLVMAMTFDSAVVASEQAHVRERLATGPFIGRFGQVEETLRPVSAAADGPTMRMEFAHDPDTDVFMTGTGPILFATCEA
jgi:hypothetical protein